MTIKTLTTLLRVLTLFAPVVWGPVAQAEASLRDEVDLIEALKRAPPCCVIDARSEAKRSQHVLADALIYRPGLNIVPTASVIVVGDDNQKTLTIGNALATQHPGKTIYAVRGGATSWEFVRKALDKVTSSSGAAPAGVSFVIPHNTCETGAPLQVLNSGKKNTKP
jgi:hypothetical protein